MEGSAAASVEELRQRIELALRPAGRPPTTEEVLERVSKHGVLHGPLDWAFPAWTAYVDYAVQRIVETFPLLEEERRQLIHFRDTLKRLLHEAWVQARAKLTSIHRAVAEGVYKIEGKRLYAPDGTWIYVSERAAPRLAIHGVSADVHFPAVLKLPQEKLELLQLGWRASDEGCERDRPVMDTSQPWQVFAWAAVRYGALRVRVGKVNLTREGVSVLIHIRAKSWEQKWGKEEAIGLVTENLRRGEWTPLLAMWLGDGEAKQKEVLHSRYKLVIAAREPWRLGSTISAEEALVATGREAFVKLREAAGAYGELLDLLRSHKWVEIKLATDEAFRAAYKLGMRKRSIDVLRETYRWIDSVPTASTVAAAGRRGSDALVVAGVEMSLHLASGRAGSLLARRYVSDLKKALQVASRLESAGLGPNVARSGPKYAVYISMADLLKLAERDVEIRRAIAMYLAEKAKSGTPRQREIAKELMKRHPIFYPAPQPGLVRDLLRQPLLKERAAQSRREDHGSHERRVREAEDEVVARVVAVTLEHEDRRLGDAGSESPERPVCLALPPDGVEKREHVHLHGQPRHVELGNLHRPHAGRGVDDQPRLHRAHASHG
ncbi:MAG: hypothetical protein LM577_02910 [Thermoproteaceae archaeon]|nr:hypothetical protein [Thermoproteaceae archaeon]